MATMSKRFRIGLVMAGVTFVTVGAIAAGLLLRSWWSVPGGRAELRAVRDDPIVQFRPDGTKFATAWDNPARRDFYGSPVPTRLTVILEVFPQTDPARVIDDYRAAATRAGWQLVYVGCGADGHAGVLTFRKQIDRYETQLGVRLELDGGGPFPARYVAADMEVARPESYWGPRADPPELRGCSPDFLTR